MKCPKCVGSPQMETRKISGVEIDHCTLCKGVWLDSGELLSLSGIDPTTHDSLWAIEVALKQLEQYTSSRKQ